MDLPLDPVAGPAEVLLPKPDAPSGAPHAAQFDDEDELDSVGVVAPSGAPHAAQFDEKDDLDDRPGLTSQEKIEYKALEARVWALVQQERLDHPHAEMSDEACRMFSDLFQ